MLTNEPAYSPPAKEKALLENARATITLLEADIQHKTGVRIGLEDAIADIQANTKSLQSDYDRQVKAKEEIDGAVATAQKTRADLQAKNTELSTKNDKLEADNKGIENKHKEREEAVSKREAQVLLDQAKADSALSEAKTLISTWEAKKSKVTALLQDLK